MFSSSRHPVLTGAFLLTAAGIISRLIGFFYRIFLSRTIGAQGLGIYQMIFPVYTLAFSFAAGGIQSALSRCCAAALSQKIPRKGWVFFLSGIFLSFSFSCLASFFLYTHASRISVYLLQEPACCELLKLLAFSLPLACVHTCISAWYFSSKSAVIPAISQLLEQIARVGFSFLLYQIFLSRHLPPSPVLAVGGLVCGELAACLFTVLCLPYQKPDISKKESSRTFSIWSCILELLRLSAPLTLNRVLVNFLQSAEAILIPGKLQSSGLSGSQAFSVYGTLTGMALPFILFPSAITSSFSTMLLPSIAGQQAEGKMHEIAVSTERTIQYCLWLGILSGGIFFFFGKELALILYHSRDAGIFLQILAFLCPFLYLTGTLTGILNGLGHTSLCLMQNLAGLGIRILFVLFAIPSMGIRGYLTGVLLSQLVITGLNLWFLHQSVPFSFPAVSWILLPVGGMVLGCGAGLLVSMILKFVNVPGIFQVLGGIFIAGSGFFVFMKQWE